MKISTNTVIRKHPAEQIDLTNDSEVPELEPLEPEIKNEILEQLAAGELDDFGMPILTPPPVRRQNTTVSLEAEAVNAEPPPPPPKVMKQATFINPEMPKPSVPCCPVFDAEPRNYQPDLDLATLGWILAGTFLIGTLTGALCIKSVSSKVASAVTS